MAFKRGDQAVEILRLARTLGLNPVVLGELLSGFALGHRQQQNRKQLRDFLDSPRVHLLTLDESTAEFYARAP
ncbi:hypothetical protein MYX65_00250 [Acidobacteria bacterium AH-259-L09]|nr:hypothetical protein [Acidobacteria bacterium AH-259-L09]